MSDFSLRVTLDLHGLRADEAVIRLERILYSRPGLRIEVIHGCGYGILRDAVRECLQSSPAVKEIVRGEEANLPGNSGVTVAYTFD